MVQSTIFMKGALIRHCVTCALCEAKINSIMAIYHFSVQTISRSAGRSSTGAAAYRSGERIYDERTGLTFDYCKKSGIEHKQIMTPENVPEWAHDRAKLWNFVELAEKRKDSQVCREVEVSLPTELNHDQQLDLVRGFIQKNFIDAGMVADLAIHRPNEENPHCHILLTMRDINVDGFGKKNRSWNDKQLLETWREQWAEHTNNALQKAGYDVRVDHRTLELQGIDRIPQIHIGPKVAKMETRGIRTDRGSRALEIELKNASIAALKSDLEATQHERDHEDSPSSQSTTSRRGARTTGRELSDTGRASTSQHPILGRSQLPSVQRVEREPEQGRQPNETSSGTGRRASQSFGTSDNHSANRSTEDQTSAARPILEVGDRSELSGHPRGTAGDRIHALAGSNSTGTEPARPAGSSRVPQARDSGRTQTPVKPDRSYLAARRQLDAMGVDTFEIGIRDQSGRMLIRTWDKAKVLESLSWLKRENARGADVYVRPAGQANAGLVLVDDLTRGALARMKADGLAPAAVTETSPDNFQAWVRVHDKPIPPELATEVAADLANRYGGDPNSADWRHFGRLAGLTNQKPLHKDANGRSPYVLAHESSGKQAERGAEVVRHHAQRLGTRTAGDGRKSRIEAAKNASERTNRRDPTQTYRNGLKALYARFGRSMDVSRADYMIGVEMAKRGFSADQIGQAIEQASPELLTRKAGHEADYVARTVKAVMNHPEVKQQEERPEP